MMARVRGVTARSTAAGSRFQVSRSISTITGVAPLEQGLPGHLVFLDNAKFRQFCWDTWHVNGHDMESTAVAQVGWVNHVPVLVVRGLCDLAGGQTGSNDERLYFQIASKNAAIVAAQTLMGLK